MTIELRDARREDLAAIVAIERVSFSDPWTRGMFSTHLGSQQGNVFLVAEDAAGVAGLAGYAITKTVMDESELLNIAVAPEQRSRGTGARLLDAMMSRCRLEGAADMWLEVRASNVGARSLYAGRGFVAVGVRKRYYHAPREDAIVLRADLLAAARDESITQTRLGFAARPNERILSTASHHPRQETK